MSKEMKERNQLITKLHKEKQYGYKKLGKMFNLTWWRIRDIVKTYSEVG